MMSFEILYIVHKRACLRREARGSHSRSFIIEVTLEEYLQSLLQKRADAL